MPRQWSDNMKDENKTKAQLSAELEEMRQRVSELEQSATGRGDAVAMQRENETRYRFFFENVNASVIFFDTDDMCVTLNKHSAAILGGKPGDFIGKSLREVFPEQADFHSQRFAKIIQEKRGAIFEDSFSLPDGVRWLSSDLQPVIDQTGNVSTIQIVATDITERKQAEEALRESEELHRLTLTNISDAVFITDATGAFTFICPNVNVIFGYSFSEVEEIGNIAGLLGDGLFDPDELESSGEISNIEREILDKVGREHALLVSVKRISIKRGTILYACRDFTNRKRAEQKLRQSQDDLDCAQAVGQIGNWRLDVQRNVLTWSDENHRIFGVPKGVPLTYETFLETVHPDDREYVDAKWKAGLAGEPYDIEHRIVLGGEVRWVREKAYLEFGNAGKLLGGFGITQDITQRKQAELRLVESERRFRTLAEHSPDIIIRFDQNLRYLYASPCIREATGIAAEKYIGRTNEEIGMTPELCQVWNAFLEQIFQTGKLSQLEYQVQTDDKKRSFETRAVPEFDDRGKGGSVMCIARDVTERKDWEGKLQKAHNQLETKVRDRTSELTMVNEKLMNQIAERKLYQDRLQAMTTQIARVEEQQRRHIATGLHDEITQNLALSIIKLKELQKSLSSDCRINDFQEIVNLIELAVENTRSLTFELSPPILYDMGLVMALKWLAERFQEKYKFKINMSDDGTPLALTDDFRNVLFQSVRECLTNAAKHAKCKTVLIAVKQTKNNISIAVKDDGIGFDPLTRDLQTREDNKFGLFNIKERLEYLGGHFELRSKAGRGTRVFLKAPLNVE